MRAIGDKVVVRKVLRTAITRGGVAIPENKRLIPQEGVVTSIGSGYVNHEGDVLPITDIKVGDRIQFERRAGQISYQGDVELRTIAYNQCLVVLETGEDLIECPMCNGNGVVHGKG